MLRRFFFVSVVVALVSLVSLVSLSAVALAAGSCANEGVRAQEGSALALPDCRAFEQVSPVAKNQADALGGTGRVQSSASGDGVTYYSLVPFPSVPGASQVPGGAEFLTYLAHRDAAGSGWMTQGLLPQSDPGTQPVILGSTEDLSKTFLYAKEPLLAEGAIPGHFNRYVHNNATGSYTWVVGPGETEFVDATPDGSKILFLDYGNVLAGVSNEREAPFLYLWDESRPPGHQVSFVGVVEGGAPEAGTVPGAGTPVDGAGFYAQNTVSDDGSRVFFTDRENGRVYVREPNANRTVAVSEGEAIWRASTPDGRFVIYTEGEDLYRFDVDSETREAITGAAAGVLGTLGISDDGDYIYFAATGSLAGGAVAGEVNLYAWHDGTVTFVARISALNEPGENTEADWRTEDGGNGNPQHKSSRVTPDGTTVLFTSRLPVTSYDNAGQVEYYLYDALRPVSPDNPLCVSCDPAGRKATSGATIGSGGGGGAAPSVSGLFLPRTLSDDGNRVFFETAEALVPQDTNGVLDVYEWERGGTGGCTGEQGGCVDLISSGRSSAASSFGDASADGNDVFFLTAQPLVSQDRDENRDLYDARVLGGLAAQNPSPPAAACVGEACRAASGSPPVFGVSSSAALAGAGNLAPSATGVAVPRGRSLTRAQKLARALKACAHGPRKRRRVCQAQARRQFGHSAGKSAHARNIAGRRHS